MQEAFSTSHSEDRLLQAYQFAFRQLSAVVTGAEISWTPVDLMPLRIRVITLGKLLGLFENSFVSCIDDLIIFWSQNFDQQAPVHLTTLRTQTRRWLTQVKSRSPLKNVDTRKIEQWLALDDRIIADVASPHSTRHLDLSAKRSCAAALVNWHCELDQFGEWSRLEGISPVDETVSISDYYVEPTTTSRILEPDDYSRLTPRFGSSSVGSTRPFQATPSSQCVVVGDPGVGKTALVKWLSWAVLKQLVPDFELAIAVRLSEYASYIDHNPNAGIVDFFVDSKLEQSERNQGAAESLRRAARKSRAFMLLMDGWDKVPAHKRTVVKTSIRREASNFFSVLTSRRSGRPWQVFEHAEVFEIHGFERSAIKEYVQKRAANVNRYHRKTQSVMRLIERVPAFRSIAHNPFLLGMLTRLLISGSAPADHLNLAQIFQQVCSWIDEHDKEYLEADFHLTAAHLNSLEALAYRMSVEDREISYCFSESELGLGFGLPEAIRKTRLVKRSRDVVNKWYFLSPTIQELFAARHLAKQKLDKVESVWRRLFFSRDRFGTLELYAGLTPQTQQLSAEMILKLIKSPDRFGIIVARACQLAFAANWKTNFPDAWNHMLDLLWDQLIENQSSKTALQGLVEVFSCIAEDELQRRIAQATESGTPLIKMIDSIESATTTSPDKEPALSVDACLERLLCKTYDSSQKVEELDQLLSKIQRNRDDVADSVWIELLLKNQDTPSWVQDRLIETAVPAIQNVPLHDGHVRRNVVSMGIRDQLLTWLTTLSPIDRRTIGTLQALTGSRILEGQELVADLVTDRNTPTICRVAACEVMKTVEDQALVQKVVDAIVLEVNPQVVDALVELSVARNTRINRPWLEKQIRRCKSGLSAPQFDKTTLATLIATYIKLVVVPISSQPEHRDSRHQFIEPIIMELLHSSDNMNHLSLFREMRRAGVHDQRIPWSKALLSTARDLVTRMPYSQKIAANSLLLALTLLWHQPDWKKLTKTLLDESHERADRLKSSDLQLLANEIARMLADCSIATLLPYKPQVANVTNALRERAHRDGLIIFLDKAYDSDGLCIADLSDNITPHQLTGPHARFETLSQLPPMQHRAVRSFQIVTEYIGPMATYEEIHSAIESGAPDLPAKLRENLDELYQGVRFPRLEAWRRSLNHATKKLNASEDGKNLLQQLGLPRR